jgi:pimeloyl-ACP methyl ester carboxylesterase
MRHHRRVATLFHRRRTPTALLAIAVITILTGCAPAGPPAQAATGVVPTALHWTACGGGFQCTRAALPLDYDDPEGATVSVAVIRLPASNPRQRIGSMLINPGGPGGSGVAKVRNGAAQVFPPEVLARFDIVGFDPRGVGRSSPIRCFASSAAQAEFFAGMPVYPAFPVGSLEQRTFAGKMKELGQRCLQRNPAIIRHMSTVDVARDMNRLRASLGDRALTFYGASYGSYLGSVYANLFPNRVRAMVFDSVTEPVAWATGHGDASTTPVFLRQHSDRGAAETLGQFLALCEQGGPRCAFSSAAPGGRARYKLDRLLAQAKRGPIVVPTPQGGTQAVTYAEIVGLVLSHLQDPDTWVELADTLQPLFEASRHPAPTTTGAQPPAAAQRTGGAYDNQLDSLLGVTCTDSTEPRDPAAWSRAAAQADRSGPFGSAWAYLSEPCATWPASDPDRYVGPFTRPMTAPVLLVGTRYDPATWYGNAKIVDHQLPSSRLLTLNGWGHVALGRSSCVTAHIARYLISRTLPPVGAVCPPDQRPFS